MAYQPWSPIRGIATQLLGFDGADPDTLQHCAEQAGLVPEDLFGLAQLFGLRPRDETPEYAVRLRETTASARRLLLNSRPSEQGLCLMFDDVEEFDGASRNFIRHLCQAARGTPVKIIVTSESDSFVGELADHTLRPSLITVKGAEQVANAILSNGGSWVELANTAYKTAEGNPFHLIQALRLLAEGGSELDRRHHRRIPLNHLLQPPRLKSKV